jgi:ubiquinone/menaquinone biosynthesis C-methylase UbiE
MQSALLRTLSTNNNFTGDTADMYARLFGQHFHDNGPWKLMVKEVVNALPSDGKGKVLDIASGPGEPACLIAEALPRASVVSTDFSEIMVEKAVARSKKYVCSCC